MMETFIAQKIKEAAISGGITAGQAKYRSYFGTTAGQRYYGEYQEEVDLILTTSGYDYCIVTV